ncbi:hypothetical protein AAG906_029380 [Vitis piasezkii]
MAQLKYASAIRSLMYLCSCTMVGCLHLVVGLSLGDPRNRLVYRTQPWRRVYSSSNRKRSEWLRDLMMDIPLSQIMCQQCRYIVTVKPL